MEYVGRTHLVRKVYWPKVTYARRKSEYTGRTQQLLTFVDFCDLGHIWTIRFLGLVGPLIFLNLGHFWSLGLFLFGLIMGFG